MDSRRKSRTLRPVETDAFAGQAMQAPPWARVARITGKLLPFATGETPGLVEE